MTDLRNDLAGVRSPNLFGLVSTLQVRDEFLRSETALLDDGLKSALRQGFASVNRNAYRTNWRTIVAQDVVAAADAVEFVSKPEQSAHRLLPGDRWEALWSQRQAAIVR